MLIRLRIKMEKFMKKRISLLVLVLTLCLSGMNVQAAEKNKIPVISKYFSLFLEEVKGVQSEDSFGELKDSVSELVKTIKPEDAKKILQFVEKKIEDGNWETEQGIKEAIAEGEKEFGVTLTMEQKELILSVIEKIKGLEIDPKYLVKQAEKIYEKCSEDIKEGVSEKGKEIMDETQNKIKEEVNKSLTVYFSDMFKSVKTFFKGLFSK